MKTCSKCKQPKQLNEFYARTEGGKQSICKECAKTKKRNYRADPVKRQREYDARKQHRRNNLDKAHASDRQHNIKRKFGIALADYDRMAEAQHGLCAICQQPETAILFGKVKRLSIDHCATSGRIRQLLCSRCNTAIGLLQHNIELLDAAKLYLLSFPLSDAQAT